jgi:hypothetical protein
MVLWPDADDYQEAALEIELQFLRDKKLAYDAFALSSLTEWESDFVGDLVDRIRRQEREDKRTLLTDRQRAVLQRILRDRDRRS